MYLCAKNGMGDARMKGEKTFLKNSISPLFTTVSIATIHAMNTNTVILLSEIVNTKIHAIWKDFCNK